MMWKMLEQVPRSRLGKLVQVVFDLDYVGDDGDNSDDYDDFVGN